MIICYMKYVTIMSKICSIHSFLSQYSREYALHGRRHCLSGGSSDNQVLSLWGGYQFHSKNIQDTVFAIPARMDRDSFDISDPAHEKELVFGRLYFNIFDNNDIEDGELK